MSNWIIRLTDQTLSLGLQLSGYYKYEASGKCEKQAALATLALVAPKATQKSQLRLGIIFHSRRSIHSRINYFNAYMLSCYYYAESACQILPKDISPQYRQLSQACLGRSWLQARHLAFILRFLRIGPALDPSIMQGVAVFGYFFRAGHTLSETHYPCTTYTKQIAAFWKIWQLRLTRKDVNTLLCIQGANPKQTADRMTACFKKLALTAQLPCSLNYLSTRCLSNGWPGSPSYRFLTQLAQIPEQHFAPVPRYTILRWAIGEDNDYWFQYRGTNISRKNPCCGCGATGKNYPISPKAGCFAIIASHLPVKPLHTTSHCKTEKPLSNSTILPFRKTIKLCMKPHKLPGKYTTPNIRKSLHVCYVEEVTMALITGSSSALFRQ